MRFLAVIVAALALAAPAWADTTFTDTVNENPAAADISQVVIGNDPVAKTITLSVQVTNLPAMTEDNAAIEAYFDADNNTATGKSGVDCFFGLDKAGWYFFKWDGAQFTQTTGLGLPVSYNNGLMKVVFQTSDCSFGTSFSFWVTSFRGADPQNPVTDDAPDGTAVYSYTQTAAPATPTAVGTAVTTSGPAKAGHKFSVTAFSVKLSDGTSVDLPGRKCTATLGGVHLKGSGAGGCTFLLPTKAKGKTLVVQVSVTTSGVTLRKTVRVAVK